MKSHKLTGGRVAVILFVLTCTANNSVMMAARTVDCRKPNEYTIAVVPNPNRKLATDAVIPKDVNIVVGDEVIATVQLPTEADAKDFSLNSAEKTKTGFKIEVDWGSGEDNYEIQFNFWCRVNNFYLYEVRQHYLSTTDRNSGNFLDKKQTKVIKIRPNLPTGKVVVKDYLMFRGK